MGGQKIAHLSSTGIGITSLLAEWPSSACEIKDCPLIKSCSHLQNHLSIMFWYSFFSRLFIGTRRILMPCKALGDKVYAVYVELFQTSRTSKRALRFGTLIETADLP